MTDAPVLPQEHAGIWFRSTLEARWAIFFDRAGIGWEYEPEGFVIGERGYRPDFRLDCGTWVEVKGDPGRLDLELMHAAARALPGREDWSPAPKLLILGSIPDVSALAGDLGWIGLEHYPSWRHARAGYYGFGTYRVTRAPLELDMLWPEEIDSVYDRSFRAYLDGDKSRKRELDEEAERLFDSLGNYGDEKFFLTPRVFQDAPLPRSAYAAARARRFGRR